MTASTKISGTVLDRNVYVDGEYLRNNPRWHTDESSFKVKHILFFTPHCIEFGEETAQKIARLPRKINFAIHQDLTVRILGGYSLLVLAK